MYFDGSLHHGQVRSERKAHLAILEQKACLTPKPTSPIPIQGPCKDRMLQCSPEVTKAMYVGEETWDRFDRRPWGCALPRRAW